MRVKSKKELAECDVFLAMHGPVHGTPASNADAVYAIRNGRGEPAAVGCVNKSTVYPGEAFLSNCAVAPHYRGLGYQRDLIAYRVRWARRAGLDGVRTYASVDNVPSMVNLLKAGFTPTEVLAEGENSYLYFRKVL